MNIPIYFISTMSAGKSTLINSLICKEIMPSSNIACTGKVINYINRNEPRYSIEVMNSEENVISKYEGIEDEKIVLNNVQRYNNDKNVNSINIYGRIPFVKINDKVKFVDLPGPNNSNNILHGEISYEVLKNIKKGTIVYVMDGTNLTSNDSDDILKVIADKIKNSKVNVLFVVNKIDYFKDMDELWDVLLEARKLIENKGINKINMYPVSSLAALSFSEYLFADESTDTSYMVEKKYFKELSYIKKFNEDIILDNRIKNEHLPFFNTGVVNLKEAIKNKI